jgi:DNA-binding FrmR family transcriptional regulator
MDLINNINKGLMVMNSLCELDKKDLVLRLKKIEGQLRGLQKMVDNEKYCVDILYQINAVQGGLKKVGLKILDKHVHGCVQRAVKNEEGDEIIDELMEVLAKFTD